MGRAQQNELRIHDISISRNHAEIIISKDDELYIRDVKSKFGTLVLVKSPEIVPELSETVSVYQIGRTVFVFHNTGKDQGQSLGSRLCKKINKKKARNAKEKYRESMSELNNQSKDAEMLLELEVEKLQKNNDSEFYLDDEFYERLEKEFNQKQNPQVLDPNSIQIDNILLENKTEDEDYRPNDEEDDEGLNPLAQTSDGKKNDLTKILRGLATNAEDPVLPEENPHNMHEEEKRVSICNENLEITINQNAPPQYRGTGYIERKYVIRNLVKEDEEEKDEDLGHRSYCEIDRNLLFSEEKGDNENEYPV
jgi:hypothetical protein